eukprot:6483355-Amphidinium_carterae.2
MPKLPAAAPAGVHEGARTAGASSACIGTPHGALCSSGDNGELCAQGSPQLPHTGHRCPQLGRQSGHVLHATPLQAAFGAAFLSSFWLWPSSSSCLLEPMAHGGPAADCGSGIAAFSQERMNGRSRPLCVPSGTLLRPCAPKWLARGRTLRA